MEDWPPPLPIPFSPLSNQRATMPDEARSAERGEKLIEIRAAFGPTISRQRRARLFQGMRKIAASSAWWQTNFMGSKPRGRSRSTQFSSFSRPSLTCSRARASRSLPAERLGNSLSLHRMSDSNWLASQQLAFKTLPIALASRTDEADANRGR